MSREQSPQTQRALAILQAAIDREALRKLERYSTGYYSKPCGHDELQEALDKAYSQQEGDK